MVHNGNTTCFIDNILLMMLNNIEFPNFIAILAHLNGLMLILET
jgi:hypothetical protein